jgi:hypothetical protein
MRGSTNNEKIAAAGFRIIRADDYPLPRIKEWKSDSSWTTLEKFDTKAARERRIQELLADPKIIVDCYPEIPYDGVPPHRITVIRDFITDSLRRFKRGKDIKGVLREVWTTLGAMVSMAKEDGKEKSQNE